MFNKLLQQKLRRQRKLSYWYISMPSVFSLTKKLNLLLNTGTVVMSLVGHSVCDNYVVWSKANYYHS